MWLARFVGTAEAESQLAQAISPTVFSRLLLDDLTGAL